MIRPRILRTHVWEQHVREIQGPVRVYAKVGVEVTRVLVAELDESHDPLWNPGVIDQDVDAAKLRSDGRSPRCTGLVVTDVERDLDRVPARPGHFGRHRPGALGDEIVDGDSGTLSSEL